jgi:hypothetical protein
MIVRGGDYETMATSLDQLVQWGWIAAGQLSGQQAARMDVLARHGEAFELDQALAMISRSTVVAAVNAVSPQERDFLAAAWRLRGNLAAYDPDMLPADGVRADLETREVSLQTCTVTNGSVTLFGQHVVDTDVLVPFPGPWVTAGGRHTTARLLIWSSGQLTSNNAGELGLAQLIGVILSGAKERLVSGRSAVRSR